MAVQNPLLPQVAKVVDIKQETPSIKTFRVVSPGGGKPFEHIPGQCAMISVPPVGEALFSITSSPTQQEYMEFSIVKTGSVTNYLHEIDGEFDIGLRGPYGNGFPIDMFQGKDILFIGGGIGLAPLRSLINYCLDKRGEFGKIDIVYGARTPEDMIQKDEIFKVWPEAPNTEVHLTVDREWEGWEGRVGFVPQCVEDICFAPDNRIAVTCGPPIMIKFVLQGLERLGFSPEQIVTTLELRMKCGVGKCGRCNIGDMYVCKDGPVFTYAQLLDMPPEY